MPDAWWLHRRREPSVVGAPMPRRAPVIATLVVSVLLVAAALWVPASASSPTSKAEADAAYAAAVELYRAGDYKDAANAFEEAYMKLPGPVLLVNAARAWERAGELDKARQRYEAVLKTVDLDPDAEHSAISGLARVKAALDGVLTAPGGAWKGRAKIGGRSVELNFFLMPERAGKLAGGVHVTDPACAAWLQLKRRSGNEYVFKTKSPRGDSLCSDLGTLRLTVTAADKIAARWSVVSNKKGGSSKKADFKLAAIGQRAEVASRTGSASGFGTGFGTGDVAAFDPGTLVVAGALAAAEDALDALPGWVGKRVGLTIGDAPEKKGSLQGVRSAIIIVELDDGGTWTGDILQVHTLRLLE